VQADLPHIPQGYRQDMKTGLNGVSVVPSPAVLRFLKIQTESLRFLHSTKAAARRPSCLTYASRTRQLPTRSQHNDSYRAYSIYLGSSNARTCNYKSALAQTASSQPRRAQRSSLRERVRSASAWSARGRERPWEAWRARRAGEAKGLEPNDLPSPLALEDTGSIGRAIKPGSELMLRCTEFDGSGNVTLINGEFKKTELIQKVR